MSMARRLFAAACALGVATAAPAAHRADFGAVRPAYDGPRLNRKQSAVIGTRVNQSCDPRLRLVPGSEPAAGNSYSSDAHCGDGPHVYIVTINGRPVDPRECFEVPPGEATIELACMIGDVGDALERTWDLKAGHSYEITALTGNGRCSPVIVIKNGR
jgi:hypothetical protein